MPTPRGAATRSHARAQPSRMACDYSTTRHPARSAAARAAETDPFLAPDVRLIRGVAGASVRPSPRMKQRMWWWLRSALAGFGGLVFFVLPAAMFAAFVLFGLLHASPVFWV